jgi:hypothetical protein
MALSMMASGQLYERFGDAAYASMALAAAAGSVFAAIAWKRRTSQPQSAASAG